jgi:hypothetical protein
MTRIKRKSMTKERSFSKVCWQRVAPQPSRPNGERKMIHERSALDVTLPKLIHWFERSMAGKLP